MRLDELLSTVVTPVLGVLVPDFRLTEVTVTVSPAGDEIQLRVRTAEESFGFWVLSPGQVPESPDELRARLADQLQDWVAETRQAWGQLRPHPF